MLRYECPTLQGTDLGDKPYPIHITESLFPQRFHLFVVSSLTWQKREQKQFVQLFQWSKVHSLKKSLQKWKGRKMVVSDFSWGEISKHLFTPNREATADQRNSSPKSSPMRRIWLTCRNVGEVFITGAWVTQQQLHHQSSMLAWMIILESCIPEALCITYGQLCMLERPFSQTIITAFIIFQRSFMNFVSFRRHRSPINFLSFLSPISWEAIGTEHSF